MQPAKSYKMMLYNIFHHKIFDDMYSDCPQILPDVTFFGVNQKFEKVYNDKNNYHIIWEWELAQFKPEMQANGYCQTSALYHIYKNKLYTNYDYIGCLQYDMKFLVSADKTFIDIFNTHQQPILYCLKGNHGLFGPGLLVPYVGETEKSCLKHYNDYFGTKWTMTDIVNNKLVNDFIMLHTFVMPKSTFEKMMKWMCDYIDNEFIHYQNKIKTSPAEFLERVHALFLAVEIYNNKHPLIEMPINHIWPMLHDQTKWDNYKQPLNSKP